MTAAELDESKDFRVMKKQTYNSYWLKLIILFKVTR